MTEAAAQKKKLPVVAERLVKESAGYSAPTDAMNFAFVSSPELGRRRASAFTTCREYVNKIVWTSINNSQSGHHTSNTDVSVDMEKLRLLIYSNPQNPVGYKEKLFHAKAVLNVLEDFAGFERSKITTVKHEGCKHVWLVTGPKEWMEYPQLLSLATLILRAVTRSGGVKSDSFDSVEDGLKALVVEDKGGNDTSTHLKKIWDKIYIILKYRKEIFEGVSISDAYYRGADDFMSESGIGMFSDDNASMYNSKVAAAKGRYLSLCKKHLPRKK